MIVDYELAADHQGRLSEKGLLSTLRNKNIRVLIDSGAFVLEMDNYMLAKTWLDLYEPGEIPGVVYFNKNNQTVVMYPQGHIVPLLASPYADDLGDCLVYLDEGHTRGTDLKIPPMAKGALTLGMNQSKDSIIQAAMRLRQLGTTQSVVIFSPPEVHQSILDLRKKGPKENLSSYDVICWLLEQTCRGIEQLQPLYYSQGIDYCRRASAALENQNFLEDDDQRESFLKSIRQFEQRTLEQLYGSRSAPKTSTNIASFSPDVANFVKDLDNLKKGFQDSGDAVNGIALQEVEQEREVAIEVQVENIREPQQTHYLPLSFPGLHCDIYNFSETGRLVADSTAFMPASEALRMTTIGRNHAVQQGSTHKLYVSAEFTRTVKFPVGHAYDQFQVSKYPKTCIL